MRSMLAAAAVRPGFICRPLTIRLASGSCREPGRLLLRELDSRKRSPSPRPSPPGEGEARAVPGNSHALWHGIASWRLASGPRPELQPIDLTGTLNRPEQGRAT